MITIYLVVFNIIMDSTIPRIVMFVNLIDKLLEICKGIRLGIIHKFVEIVYFLIDISKVAIALAATIIILIESLL